MEGGLLGALAAEVGDAKLVIGAAGAVILGVVLAQRAIYWLELVIINREASRDAEERERNRI